MFDADGWFRTGDIGELDADGYLRITGRKKELIVTAAGKNVAPAPLEDRLRAHPLISQAVVVGDQRPFVAAMLAIDEEALQEWATDRDLESLALAEVLAHELLRAHLQEAVDEANRSVSKAESIRAFAILPRDLTIESGELTPTLKVRRAVVAKTYDSVVEEPVWMTAAPAERADRATCSPPARRPAGGPSAPTAAGAGRTAATA